MNTQLFKGIMLVAGTSIGGGMLALPVLTSLTGMWPAYLVYLLCWAFMTATGLLMLEAALWMPEHANVISMADRTLGKWGKVAAWILYLFLFSCLTVAYTVGCGDLVVELFQESIPEWLGSLIFILLFAPLIYAGAHVVGPVNAWLVGGLAASYLIFVVLGVPHVQSELLARRDWPYITTAFPIAFTSFAYQGIIPTLIHYMDRNVRDLKLTIIIGSFIPLVVYMIWQALIMGIVPFEGEQGLLETLQRGEDAVFPLRHFLKTPIVFTIGQFFAFFALVTSFIGVTLGLVDFLADGLNVQKNQRGRRLLCLLIFLPPLVISYLFPGLFLVALDLAGGVGCALLLGLLPILMVWSGRYHLGLEGPYEFNGGKAMLILLFLFVIFELACNFI